MFKTILFCCSIVAALTVAEGNHIISVQSSKVCSVPAVCDQGGKSTTEWKELPQGGKDCDHGGDEDTIAEIEDRVEELENSQSQTEEKLEVLTLNSAKAREGCVRAASCDDVHKMDAEKWNENGGGLFQIFLSQVDESTDFYCDLTTDGGRWTVFQRRVDGSEDFYRGWNDYVDGFGDKEHEFWMGLETIHEMTKGGNYELRVDMEDWDGNKKYAKYSTFSVGNREDNYRLAVGGYSGDAGDSMLNQNGQMFTTRDNDNDKDPTNCAVRFKGAWWHNHCHASNLNGEYFNGGPSPYGEGINWRDWKGYEYSLKSTEMKFRRRLQ